MTRRHFPTGTLPTRVDTTRRHTLALIAGTLLAPGTRAQNVSYASPGIGTSLHLTMEEIAQREGIEWLHVPFKGSADAYAALRGGQVACQAGTPQWEAVDAGQLRVLNTWSDKRNPRSTNAPTLKELYGIVANSPWGIAGPRGMDARIVRFLHDHIRKAMDDVNFLATLTRVGQEPYYLSGEDYAAFARVAYEKEGEVVARLKLKPQPRRFAVSARTPTRSIRLGRAQITHTRERVARGLRGCGSGTCVQKVRNMSACDSGVYPYHRGAALGPPSFTPRVHDDKERS